MGRTHCGYWLQKCQSWYVVDAWFTISTSMFACAALYPWCYSIFTIRVNFFSVTKITGPFSKDSGIQNVLTFSHAVSSAVISKLTIRTFLYKNPAAITLQRRKTSRATLKPFAIRLGDRQEAQQMSVTHALSAAAH